MTVLTTEHILGLDRHGSPLAILTLDPRTGEIDLTTSADGDNGRSLYTREDGQQMYGNTSRYDEDADRAAQDPAALLVLMDIEKLQAQIDSAVQDEDGCLTLEGAAILVDWLAGEHHLEREVSYALQTGDHETGWQTVAFGTEHSADRIGEYARAVLDTQWCELRAEADNDDEADEMIAAWRVRAVVGPGERVDEYEPTQSAVCDGSDYRAQVTVSTIRDLQREERRLAEARRKQVRRLVAVTGSQVAAAARLGVSQPTISEMLNRGR